ncbi:MAG TPA: YihY/virulence factor BrkB family protein [Bryobacteraceae bacterium]|nr:YihY/virulence factor BrkB family protein [Bryobacteraceae bacterium]
MSVRKLAALWGEAFEKWSDHDAPRLGAALAFYTLFSLAPLLVFLVGLLSIVFGKPAVQQRIVDESVLLVGRQGAETIRGLMAPKPGAARTASLLASLVLLFGASGVFRELQSDLNEIWDVKPPPFSFRRLFSQQLFAFALVLGIGLLLLASMLATIAVSLIGRFLPFRIPIPVTLLQTANALVSFGLVVLLFGLIFRLVPDRKLPWRVVWIGAAVSAVLFGIGKALLGFYFGWASVGSAYGAAGSLVAVVVWIYYSAQIFLLGAEFTWIYSKTLPAGGQAGEAATSGSQGETEGSRAATEGSG